MSNSATVRRLAAILAADIAGYSRLMGLDEDGTLAQLKSHRRELIDPKIDEFGGRIVKTTGDGLLVEFPSVVAAVQCAVDVQRSMMERNRTIPTERRIQFRVGINIGDIIIDGDDIFGDGVNIAARLESMSEPGGVCVSRAVVDQVKQKLQIAFEDLGNQALKNIDEPVRTYRITRAQAEPVATSVGAVSPDIIPHLPERPSVAIMAFKNLNGDPEYDYIADGIALGIQTLLVQLSGLFFVNACTDKAYKQGLASAKEVLRTLPVRYALEGAAQTAGDRVRVTVQLTDLRKSAVVWADRYDRELADVFALQDDITREVISSISTEVLGVAAGRIWTKALSGHGAWEYFLRGLSHFYKFNAGDNARARQMFENLYQIYPEKTIGPNYIGITHWLDASQGWSSSPDASLNQAAEWAEKATASDDENNGLGHAVLGSIRLLERRFDDALNFCRKSVSFRANCPFALGQLASVQNYCGDADGAIKSAREALSVRLIYMPPTVNVLAAAYRDSGQIGFSISAAREATRLNPESIDAFATLCSDYALAGDSDEARQIADRIVGLDPDFSVSSYAGQLPYKDPMRRAKIVEALRSAGLPD